MNNYTPFLKLKTNEVTALSEVDISLQYELTPFFDFPRDNKAMSEEKFITKAGKAQKSIAKHLKNIPSFYLDNFDIDSNLTIDGNSNYNYLLELFSNLPMIPVVGIDRNDAHINSVINAKKTSVLNGNQIAIRFTPEDFEEFELVADDIEDMLNEVIEMFEEVDIIFDCRVCINQNVNTLSLNIIDFIKKFTNTYEVNKIIITGSSIPASISDIISTDTEIEQIRNELSIFNIIFKTQSMQFNLFLGDYGVVSPNYSDINIKSSLMRTVTAPKILYPFEKKHFIIRGRGLQQYGNGQYNTLSKLLVSKHFYRGNTYSYGDNFLEEKSLNKGNQVTQSTILKPTINAHITYMLNDYTY